jgi:hypothetical protein
MVNNKKAAARFAGLMCTYAIFLGFRCAPPQALFCRLLRRLRMHACEYKGQWGALDGDRLIAHGANADDVFDAAEANGANLPLVGFVDDPDKIYAGF